MWLLVCSIAVESKLVKLETSHTVSDTSRNVECSLDVVMMKKQVKGKNLHQRFVK